MQKLRTELREQLAGDAPCAKSSAADAAPAAACAAPRFFTEEKVRHALNPAVHATDKDPAAAKRRVQDMESELRCGVRDAMAATFENDFVQERALTFYLEKRQEALLERLKECHERMAANAKAQSAWTRARQTGIDDYSKHLSDTLVVEAMKAHDQLAGKLKSVRRRFTKDYDAETGKSTRIALPGGLKGPVLTTVEKAGETIVEMLKDLEMTESADKLSSVVDFRAVVDRQVVEDVSRGFINKDAKRLGLAWVGDAAKGVGLKQTSEGGVMVWELGSRRLGQTSMARYNTVAMWEGGDKWDKVLERVSTFATAARARCGRSSPFFFPQIGAQLLMSLWNDAKFDAKGNLLPFKWVLAGVEREVYMYLGGDRPWINAVLGLSSMLHTNGCCSCVGKGRCKRQHTAGKRTYLGLCKGAHYRQWEEDVVGDDGVAKKVTRYGPSVPDFGGAVGYTCDCCQKNFKTQEHIIAEVQRVAALTPAEFKRETKMHKGQKLGRAPLIPFHEIVFDVLHAVSAMASLFFFGLCLNFASLRRAARASVPRIM